MYKQKFITLIMVTLILVSGIASIQAATIQKDELDSSSTKVTLMRCGVDGNIEPIDIFINVRDKQNLGKAIADKCEELFYKDAEMQNFIKNSSLNIGLFCKIKSSGKGFHYQMKLLGKFAIRYILFRLGLPRLQPIFVKPLVFCSYKKDPNANTTISSLVFNRTQFVEGNHSVLVRNFIGYTSWIGRFSFSPLDIFPRGFFGYAKYAVCISSK